MAYSGRAGGRVRHLGDVGGFCIKFALQCRERGPVRGYRKRLRRRRAGRLPRGPPLGRGPLGRAGASAAKKKTQ